MPQLLDQLNGYGDLPSIQMLKNSLGRLGYDDNLHTVYLAFQKAIEEEIQRQISKIPEECRDGFAIEEISNKVKSIF